MAEEPGQENRDAPSTEDKPSRGRLIGFAIAGAILVILILLVWVKPSDPTEKKDFIQAVGVLLAALAGLGGLYFTSQNLKQTRQDTEKQLQQARDSTNDQLQQARESQWQNQRLTEQGQITERFTRAIEQLGATDDTTSKPRLELRLGGIYALERIAKDSPERDYDAVIEVLTAYVRENAPWRPEASKPPASSFIKPPGGGSVSDPASNEASEQDKDTVPGAAPGASSAHPTDIQAILTVIARRKGYYGNGEPGGLDLRGTDLQGMDLRGTYLRRSTGPFARDGAHLEQANLQQANLRYAVLQGAYLQGAVLQDANLEGANLQGANLEGANLQRANLQDADLQEAKLQYAKLQYSNLQDANLEGASLLGANLQGTYDLQGANLQGADLQGANLKDADLRGVVQLTQAQIEDALGNKYTTLTERLHRPVAWSKNIEEQ